MCDSRAVADRSAPQRDLVVVTACVMVVAYGAARAWALGPSWFQTDDYRLLDDATRSGLTPAYLLEPFDSQLMPLGRAIAWVVADSGADWTLAATLGVVMHVLAAAACAWMLVTLFGTRWEVLPLLGLFLTSALTMPAGMWWAASLNQLPFLAVLCAAVGCWVRHLRTGRRRWLAATVVVLAVGLLCYVKTLLVVGLLVLLLLTYFRGLRRAWPAAVAVGALVTGYAAYYLTHVPSLVEPITPGLAAGLAETMLGRSLSTGLVGGPWRWDASNPPTAYADPPAAMVVLAWCLLLAVMAATLVLRRHAGRAWLVLAAYAGAAWALVLVTRATVAGQAIGTELRYLTELPAVAVLCLGLATLPLRGADVVVAPRRALPHATRPAAVVVACVVMGSGAASSAAYAQVWHDQHPGADYVDNVRRGLAGRGPSDLADQVVPARVVPPYSAPHNSTRRLLPLVVDGVRFPEVSSSLLVLDDAGVPHRAVIDPATRSIEGPEPGCGWRVEDAPVTIPLRTAAVDFEWWLWVGYLGSGEGTMQVTVAGTTREVPVRKGLHGVFLHVEGAVDEVRLGGLPPGVAVCVDRVELGQPVPGAPL